jgi:FdhD protein
MAPLPPPTITVPVTTGHGTATTRTLPEETAIALTYDRATFAVMMASPLNLQDFALGFSLAEGIIATASDITNLEIIPLPTGIECRMTLVPARRDALETRRRFIAGPAGCGLCGLDSLDQAIRPPAPVTSTLTVTAAQISAALAALPAAQTLNHATRAAHAAGFYNPATATLLLREDVGRHNALDKLIGALHQRGDDPTAGIVLLTSRVSIELIQKTAALGAAILVAVSVPSARAVRDAAAAGITLIGIARADGFEIFTHPGRILPQGG